MYPAVAQALLAFLAALWLIWTLPSALLALIDIVRWADGDDEWDLV